jgi:hypothetical protein
MPLAKKARVADDHLYVTLRDGRVLNLPLSWFPTLNHSPGKARFRVRLVGPGVGLEWPDLGYELGVGGLACQRGPLKY